MASAARWMVIGTLLAAAIAQVHGACQVVTHKTLAEKTDDRGRRLFLVAVVVAQVRDDGPDHTTPVHGSAPVSDDYNDNDNDNDDDDGNDNDHAHENGAAAWATASWVDAAQRDAIRRVHRPGTGVPCTDARGTARDVDPPAQRSEPGAGPRIAAFCAAAAAVALVLGCGVLACASKMPWCRRIWLCGRHRTAAWDGDDASAHRLIDSVFG